MWGRETERPHHLVKIQGPDFDALAAVLAAASPNYGVRLGTASVSRLPGPDMGPL